jgi:hypothetical protein
VYSVQRGQDRQGSPGQPSSKEEFHDSCSEGIAAIAVIKGHKKCLLGLQQAFFTLINSK